MQRTIDYIRDCPGYWQRDYCCRIEVYEHPGLTPVVVCTPLPYPDGRTPQALHDYIAAEVIRAHFPHLFEATDEPLVWIDRNARPHRSPHWPGDTAYTRVTFDWYTPPDKGLWDGIPMRSIGTPASHGMSRAAVAELIEGTTRLPCARGCGRPATVEWEPERAGDPAPWVCATCDLAADEEDDEG